MAPYPYNNWNQNRNRKRYDYFAGFKYRIYPNREQEKIIVRTIGCCRFVYNHFYEEAAAVYKEKEVFPDRQDLLDALPALMEEHPFLKEVNREALESAIDQLIDAEKRFQKKVSGFPKKKRRGSGGAFKVRSASPGDGCITMPEYGTFKCVVSRPLGDSLLRAGRISMTPSGKFYISMNCGMFRRDKPKTGAAVGVDLGIDGSVVTSDGEILLHEQAYSQERKKLARLQRAFSRKLEAGKNAASGAVKGRNLTENRLRITTLNERIKNHMRDSIEKVTTRLVTQYDMILIEDYDVPAIRGNKDYSKQIQDLSVVL